MLTHDEAFSLIELSIVSIVLSLFVAGIIGCVGLIENAKTAASVNEFRANLQNIITFELAQDRLPGDLKKTGKIGFNSGQTYNNSSYSDSKYVSSNLDYGIPSSRIAPFVDLFLAHYINFEPKKNEPESGVLDWNNGGSPSSKTFKDFILLFKHIEEGNESQKELAGLSGNTLAFHYRVDPNQDNILNQEDTSNQDENKMITISPESAQKIDKKIDDGLALVGKVRSACYELEYENAISENKDCNSVVFKIDFY